MLSKDMCVGDFTSLKNSSIKVTEDVRLYMITVIVEIQSKKDYSETTLYLACSLADRYLATLAVN